MRSFININFSQKHFIGFLLYLVEMNTIYQFETNRQLETIWTKPLPRSRAKGLKYSANSENVKTYLTKRKRQESTKKTNNNSHTSTRQRDKDKTA